MRIDWFSQTGSDRTNNCDAACYGKSEQAIVVAIVDAAESEKAQSFARHWAATLVTAANMGDCLKDASRIVNKLANAQKELRHTFLHEIASYALAVIQFETGDGILLSSGDCLVGVSAVNSIDLVGVRWLNSLHTADRQMSVMGEPSSPASGIEHVLTRSIKANRFCAPDIEHFSINVGQVLVMVTDGYWREQREQNGSPKLDDSSCLSLNWGVGALEVRKTTDTNNLVTFEKTMASY